MINKFMIMVIAINLVSCVSKQSSNEKSSPFVLNCMQKSINTNEKFRLEFNVISKDKKPVFIRDVENGLFIGTFTLYYELKSENEPRYSGGKASPKIRTNSYYLLNGELSSQKIKLGFDFPEISGTGILSIKLKVHISFFTCGEKDFKFDIVESDFKISVNTK